MKSHVLQQRELDSDINQVTQSIIVCKLVRTFYIWTVNVVW